MGADTPTSHAKNLEHLKTPTQEKIVAAVRRVCDANGNRTAAGATSIP